MNMNNMNMKSMIGKAVGLRHASFDVASITIHVQRAHARFFRPPEHSAQRHDSSFDHAHTRASSNLLYTLFMRMILALTTHTRAEKWKMEMWKMESGKLNVEM